MAVQASGELGPSAPEPDDPVALDADKLLDVVVYLAYRVAF